jgi:pimeloyl-ACP methyl ester carboxylesterase
VTREAAAGRPVHRPSVPVRVTVDPGIEVVVHDFGGDGEPLLFCHANGFHGRIWEPLVARLPSRRCLALDFRGFGDSTPPTETVYDWQQLGDDVLAVVAHFGLTDVEAVGHSMGGAALLLAELARPATFRHLFLYEPIVFPTGPDPAGNPLAEMTRRRRVHFDSVEDAVARYATKSTLGTLRADCLELYVRHGFRRDPDGGITLKATPEHEARHYEAGTTHPTWDLLGGVTCPVTVAVGGDGGYPAEVAPVVAERLPAGELLTFDSLGHFGPLEDPDLVTGDVQNTLAAGSD